MSELDSRKTTTVAADETEDVERPQVYIAYEQNIGALTPMLADELRDAVAEYGEQWTVDAIREAVRHEKRFWKYALGILKSWKREGRREVNSATSDDAPPEETPRQRADRLKMEQQMEEFKALSAGRAAVQS